MLKSFGGFLMLVAISFSLFSCAPQQEPKAANRSIIQQKQWKADSLAARQFLAEMYPDTSVRKADSLAVDSLKADSLLR